MEGMRTGILLDVSLIGRHGEDRIRIEPETHQTEISGDVGFVKPSMRKM